MAALVREHVGEEICFGDVGRRDLVLEKSGPAKKSNIGEAAAAVFFAGPGEGGDWLEV